MHHNRHMLTSLHTIEDTPYCTSRIFILKTTCEHSKSKMEIPTDHLYLIIKHGLLLPVHRRPFFLRVSYVDPRYFFGSMRLWYACSLSPRYRPWLGLSGAPGGPTRAHKISPPDCRDDWTRSSNENYFLCVNRIGNDGMGGGRDEPEQRRPMQQRCPGRWRCIMEMCRGAGSSERG